MTHTTRRRQYPGVPVGPPPEVVPELHYADAEERADGWSEHDHIVGVEEARDAEDAMNNL